MDYSCSHGISRIHLNSSHKTAIVAYIPLSFFSVMTGFHTSTKKAMDARAADEAMI